MENWIIDTGVFLSAYEIGDYEYDAIACQKLIKDCKKGYNGFISIITIGEIVKNIIEKVSDPINISWLLSEILPNDIKKFRIISLDNDVVKIFNNFDGVYVGGNHDKLIVCCGIIKNCTLIITTDTGIQKASNGINKISLDRNKHQLKAVLISDMSKYKTS